MISVCFKKEGVAIFDCTTRLQRVGWQGARWDSGTMKASFASMKKRYCQKLGEQVLWDDGDASVPVCAPGQLCVRCT